MTVASVTKAVAYEFPDRTLSVIEVNGGKMFRMLVPYPDDLAHYSVFVTDFAITEFPDKTVDFIVSSFKRILKSLEEMA